MPTPFSPATAEQLVSAVEAVFVNTPNSVNAGFVADFADIPVAQADSALQLASQVGFLADTGNGYVVSSPLCRLLVTPNDVHRASALRIALETFDPFLVFRQRLIATDSVTEAARQAKMLLDLDGHRDSIKDTLISMGTYSRALTATGGGRYATSDTVYENPLHEMARACADQTAAESRIREQIGDYTDNRLHRQEVVIRLADALLCARNHDSRGAVVRAGNAIESYLASLGNRMGANLQGAHGINSKLDRLQQSNSLPRKIINVGKYLGHIRNAADHGVDPDINASWEIRESTGLEYVFVACSFISSTLEHEDGASPIL